MNKPTHKHTHLQAAQSQRTDQSLQKSVLFANALEAVFFSILLLFSFEK